MPTYVKPSGAQHRIRSGPWWAVVTEVGATLRELGHEEDHLLDGFRAEEMASAGRGQVLAPWPNRVRDGRYRFGGQDFQLALSEPGRGNASHGLVRWLPWTRVESGERESGEREAGESEVLLACRLHPQPGYPFQLRLEIGYRLSESGLEVTFRARNEGPDAAPFGVGFHPYLRAGAGPVDGWQLRVPARERLLTDSRMLPVGREAVAGDFDFRELKQVGRMQLDTCFTGLEGDRVTVAGDRTLQLWFDPGFSHLMVFSGDGLPERAREGLAVEPMTCAPDAFNSGEGLRTLEPDEEVKLRWGISKGITLSSG